MALRRAGFRRIRILAPPAGDALVGSGPSEVDERLPWEGAELARRIAGEATTGPLDAALARAEIVIAYTRADAVARALRPPGGRMLQHDPGPPPGGPHASAWLLEPLGSLGIRPALVHAKDADAAPPDLVFSSDERTRAARVLASLPRRLLAVHAGSGSPSKRWPAERFAALATRLAGSSPFLLVLGPAEQDQRWDDVPGAAVARELPLRTLGAVLSQVDVFVGNDSGVAHLAAASGAPTLALFGPTDPATWAPLGRVVRCSRAPATELAALSVDAVAAEASALRAYVDGERTSTRLIRR